VSNPVHQVLKNGNIVGLANHTVLIARTGKEYQIADSAAPIRNRPGQITGVVLVFHDVTEQYRAAAALQQSEASLAAAQASAHLGNWELDLQTLKGFWSAENFRLHRRDPSLGPPTYTEYLELVHPDDRQRVSEVQARLADANSPVEFEFRSNPSLGPVRTFSNTISTLREASGRAVRATGTTLDITERKQAEQTAQVLRDQLIQSTKMEAVGHLTAGIAHDFNNILGAILGYTELSKHVIAAGTPEVGERYMDEILKAIQRAKELIAQMLTFSRLSPGTKGEDSPAIKLTPVVKEVVSLLRSSIPSTIELNYRVENPELKAQILPVHLHQIILNLGINARDAIGEYGKIDITLASQHVTRQVCSSCQLQYAGEFVKLTIHDTGSGIAEHIQKNIFNPFFTTKGVGKGTGMGLSVVHGLVHALGGHIRVESKPGKGTALSILLPLAASEAAADVYTAMPETSAGTLAGIRIMVVDDEAAMTAILHEFLSLHGAKITAYNSPLLAWNAFEQQPQGVDLVISDETMPGLSGMHLAQRMLKLRPELPVILCTGYSAHATPELAEQAGLAGFFLKPLQMSELLQKLRKICLARGIGQLRKPEQ
jgi:signal transduction histidine kinase/CheY-like chemotaxis protein